MDVGALDGVSVILGALAVGAGEGIAEVVKQAVLDLRDKLKARFGGDEEAAADLSVYMRRPTPQNAEHLSGYLREHGLDQNREVLAVARAVLDAAGPTALGAGSVAATVINQSIHDHGKGFIGGTHHHGTPPSSAL